VTEQLTLDAGPIPDIPRHRLPPAEQWQLACDDNPHLEQAVVDCARQLKEQGRRVTVNRIWEELRERIWTQGDSFRMNNTWRAPAAAWLKREWPDLAGDVKTRGAA
jgi:hypothetical protein